MRDEHLSSVTLLDKYSDTGRVVQNNSVIYLFYLPVVYTAYTPHIPIQLMNFHEIKK